MSLDKGKNFPLAKGILEENVYVDDCLFGADDIEEAKEVKSQVTEILKSGGFHLRKWVSNEPSLLDDCPSGSHELAVDLPFEDGVQLKVLGLTWNPGHDLFQII